MKQGRRSRFSLSLALVLHAAGGVGCGDQASVRDEPADAVEVAEAVSPAERDESARALDVLVSWFECEECDEGQLEGVVALGPAAVPSLAAALRHGPAPERRAEIERELSESYTSLVAYAVDHRGAAPAVTQGEYVRIFSSNFVAMYQARGATALGALPADGGHDSLRAVLPDSLSFRRDVLRSIRSALPAPRIID